MPSPWLPAGGRVAAGTRRAIVRVNALVDDCVERALALVAHRLNHVVASVDRLDGGSGLGLTIATLMARLTGFEVRERRTAVAHAGRRRSANRAARGRGYRLTSFSTPTPSASAWKFSTTRCPSTLCATAFTSSRSGTLRPSSAARALAPRIMYWPARGPAP